MILKPQDVFTTTVQNLIQFFGFKFLISFVLRNKNYFNFVLVLFLTSCVASVNEPTTDTPLVINALKFSYTSGGASQSTIDFGTVASGATKNLIIYVENISPAKADFIASAALAAPFGYIGGAFPGTAGTCTATLNSGANCTLSLKTPARAGLKFTTTVQLLASANVALQVPPVPGKIPPEKLY